MRRPHRRSGSSSRTLSSRSLRAGALIGAVLALLPATRAEAQQSATEAAAAFDQGTQYFAGEQYALALESFQTAYRLRAHPAILLNVAACFDRLGQAPQAVAEYLRYRRLRGSGIEPERRRFVEESLRRLGPQVAFVWVRPPGPGALVRLDGSPVEIGEDPLVLPPGHHRVEGRAADGRQVEAALLAEAGRTHRVDLLARLGPAPPPRGSAPARGGGRPAGASAGDPPGPPNDPGGRAGGSGGWDRSLRWIGLGGTLVLGGCLIFTASRTLSLADEFDRTGDESVKQEGLTYRTVTELVFFPATLLAAGFTVLAFVFAADDADAPSAPSALLIPTPDGFVLAARGRF